MSYQEHSQELRLQRRFIARPTGGLCYIWLHRFCGSRLSSCFRVSWGRWMPRQPPRFKPKGSATQPPTSGWIATSRKSRQERGYGRAHDVMRQQVLREEPICRICLQGDPSRVTATVIADHIVPKAGGGGNERQNYQGVCAACHLEKTAAEAAQARRRLNLREF